MRVYENASLYPHTTLHIDVRARFLVVLETVEDVLALATEKRFVGIPKFVLGGGSNVLFREDYRGLVALNRLRGIGLSDDDGREVRVWAAAGENWHDFVLTTLAWGLRGLENLSLIPGTVGAAPIQNIGAYGVELSERFESLQAVRFSDGVSETFSRGDCRFGYRDSVFKSACRGRYLITAVTFRLSRVGPFVTDYRDLSEALRRDGKSPVDAARISAAVCRIRRRKLPDPAHLGNVGSFFKNPVVDATTLGQLRRRFQALPAFGLDDGRYKLPAAWLIEHCGWKGWRRGDAGVYDRHAQVLVNYGHASGAEIWHLATAIMASVADRFGIELEPEPLIL